MLIPSPRHAAADRELWADLEAADRAHAPRIGPKVERSLAALRLFLDGGPAYCGVSWGKDSVVVAHLCATVAPAVPLVNLRCSNRNPDCDAVCNEYRARFPDQRYIEHPIDYEGLHARNLPAGALDRETDRRWYAGIRRLNDDLGHRHILGIRAGESAGRKMRCRVWGENSPNGCAPLAWWTTADVFAYLATHSLPVHPAYAMLGGGRWGRERLRVAEIGDTHGTGGGRAEWEREYYGDVLRRLAR
ncbi:Phosphoadenosine phosphosulfate reductase family protein [Gemmata sp. SH-PL17]|uniref:phosphoadenosine phosphosulfate reductase domain-containing protein n=1 Tax=Gemmata sp. SH-PL17 TaxID=1630693 RepID=UPI00078E364E|nr:phosphoadenosine phosphosulfate reductase family protein [Gemmata sp. SH-PL17]AMV24610.1 Phosphoadenosine phosphosulfate reductase family protein [Gemmata sp. SH-PL17]